MKAVMAAIGGFVGGGALLGCGAVLAVHMMTTETGGSLAPGSAMADEAPAIAPTAAASKPRTEDFERIAPRPPTESQLSLARNAVPNGGNANGGDGVDLMQTAALPAGNNSVNAAQENEGLADPAQEEMLAAHVDWCANRYRSYRPRDNSYTPYSGGRSVCVSPYSESLSAGLSASPNASRNVGISAPPASSDSFGDEEAGYQQVSAQGSGVIADNAAYSPNHIAYCFGRYRSYDPADNSYQPYNGGPRQQCAGN